MKDAATTPPASGKPAPAFDLKATVAAVLAIATSVGAYLTQPNAQAALLIVAVAVLAWLLWHSKNELIAECRAEREACRTELAKLREEWTDLRRQYPDRRKKRTA